MDVIRAPSNRSGHATLEEITRFVVGAAVHAPSVHNTQPWWFTHDEQRVSVHADPARQLRTADPHGRELMISCGAALFTARVALRYRGYVPKVSVLPDAGRPTLVARISIAGRVPATDYEQDLFTQITHRRTHRGGFDSSPVPPEVLAVLGEEAAQERAVLRIVTNDEQQAALAAMVAAGDHTLRLDRARGEEEAHWAPAPGSSRRDGVPPTAYPARPEQTSPHFPSRDFAHGHDWGLLAPRRRPGAAGIVCLLTTNVDDPQDWVCAGQALQRILLNASGHGLAAAMHSQPLEVPELREFIRIRLCARAHPQMILRFGASSETAESIRRPVDEVCL